MKLCRNCRRGLDLDSLFCSTCGAKYEAVKFRDDVPLPDYPKIDYHFLRTDEIEFGVDYLLQARARLNLWPGKNLYIYSDEHFEIPFAVKEDDNTWTHYAWLEIGQTLYKRKISVDEIDWLDKDFVPNLIEYILEAGQMSKL